MVDPPSTNLDNGRDSKENDNAVENDDFVYLLGRLAKQCKCSNSALIKLFFEKFKTTQELKKYVEHHPDTHIPTPPKAIAAKGNMSFVSALTTITAQQPCTPR